MDDMKRTSEYRKLLPFIAKASGDVGTDTQGEEVQALILALNTHKSSADHDGRYYTETEVGTLFTNHNSSGDHDGRYYTESEITTFLSAKADKTLTLTAGNGLTGGGDLSANRTFAVGAGTGITVNADDVAINLAANLTWTGLHTFTQYLSTNSIYPSTSDVYDLGNYNTLWRKIWGSELSAIVFAKYEQVLLGGWLTISKGEGTLPAAINNTQTQIDLGAAFTTNDILVFRGISSTNTPQVEYMKVGTLVSGTTYNVTRNLDGTGANGWPVGTVFGNWGTTGNGRVELNAYDTPRLSVYSHGAAIADFREQVRIGDLNGGWGYSSSVYGGAFGSYETGKANITIDPTNGLRIRNYDQDVIKLTGTTASFENFITLGASGGIRQGTGTWGSSFTGTAMWNDSGVMNIGGWNAGVKQWWGSSDGKLYAGGGNLYLDYEGLVFIDTLAYGSKISWEGYAAGVPYGAIEDYTVSGLPNFSRYLSFLLTAPYATNRTDSILFGIQRGGVAGGYSFSGLNVYKSNAADTVYMTYTANGGHTFVGNVGIGTASPTNNLSIGSVGVGTFNGIGIGAAGNNDIRIGQDSAHSIIVGWKYNATVGSAYSVLETYGGTNPLILQSAGGSVGIGKSPAVQFELSGAVGQKSSGTTWSNPSDKRLKKNIKPFTDGLNVITKIKPVHYELNGLAGTPKGLKGISVIAQEIRDVAPYTVDTYKAKLHSNDEEDTELYRFEASALIFALINAVKELNDLIKKEGIT